MKHIVKMSMACLPFSNNVANPSKCEVSLTYEKDISFIAYREHMLHCSADFLTKLFIKYIIQKSIAGRRICLY